MIFYALNVFMDLKCDGRILIIICYGHNEGYSSRLDCILYMVSLRVSI
jgi:hypothetical protein